MSKGLEESGFWAEGQRQFLSALAAKEKEELRHLAEELSSATEPARRAELKKAIADVLAANKRTRREADQSLFFAEGGLGSDSETDR